MDRRLAQALRARGLDVQTAPRAIENVDLRLPAQGEGRVVEKGPYDERRGHEQSRFRERIERQRL
jgi:IS5 family transposase